MASAFGSLNAHRVQSIVDRLAGAGLAFALTERILAFGSSSTDSGESSNTRAIRGHRFLKRSVVAATMLLAMSNETLLAEGLGVAPSPAALVGSSIDWRPFDTAPLGYYTEPVQKIRVQMTDEKSHLITYFLDQVPNDINASTMPRAARDIVVARVSMERRPVYLVRREQSGERSAPPKNLFRSELKILQVLSGRAMVGQSLDVTFGVPNNSGKLTFTPHTPSQVSRDYVVVIYTDDDDQRRLAGFPIDEAQYLRWESEVRELIKLPWKPGAPK